MVITERQVHDLWMQRITETIGLLEDNLTKSEGRNALEIKLATQVFRDWAEMRHPEDEFVAFTLAWPSYCGLCMGLVYREGDDLVSFGDIPYEATPAWEKKESLLIAGLALALRARDLLQANTKKAYATAAMMYADAAQALDLWNHYRGFTKSRKPHEPTRRWEAAIEAVKGAEKMRIQKSAEAKKYAQKKHAKSPIRAHMPEIKEMWDMWQKNPAQYRSGAAFDRAAVNEYPDITSTVTITRWRKEWERNK